MGIKKIKTSAILSLSLACCMLLSGCAQSVSIEGSEEIERVRKEYAELSSGCYTVVNGETMQTEQTYAFAYNDDKTLAYCCTGTEKGEPYTELHDGIILTITKNGSTERYGKSDAGWYGYTKKKPHPYAAGGLLFYYPDLVKSASSKKENGSVSYIYSYDTDKLAKKLGMAEGSLIAYTTTYCFEGETLRYFEQNSTVSEDGKENSYRYTVTLDKANALSPADAVSYGE